jgi:hypothetical protein
MIDNGRVERTLTPEQYMMPTTPHRGDAEDKDKEFEDDPCAYVERNQPVYETGEQLDTREGASEMHYERPEAHAAMASVAGDSRHATGERFYNPTDPAFEKKSDYGRSRGGSNMNYLNKEPAAFAKQDDTYSMAASNQQYFK